MKSEDHTCPFCAGHWCQWEDGQLIWRGTESQTRLWNSAIEAAAEVCERYTDETKYTKLDIYWQNYLAKQIRQLKKGKDDGI